MSSGEWRIVLQGESVESIAVQSGHWPDSVWMAPENADLRSKRAHPDILLPGDRLFIPPCTIKEFARPTERRHSFMRRGVPSRLRVRFLIEGKPRANEAYTLTFDGSTRQGTTDADGAIDERVSPVIREITLRFNADPAESSYALLARHLNPIQDIAGVQMRLRNLGFTVGPLDGLIGRSTRSAISAFQTKNNLEPTGEPDQATRDRLVEVHGS